MFSYSYGRDAGRKGRNNMSDRILLNDILHLSDEDIERTRVRFNLNDGATDPIEEFKRDPDVVSIQWLLWRNDKNMFTVGQIAICLVRCLDNKDHWLLTTIRHIDADNGVKNGVAYEASDLENYNYTVRDDEVLRRESWWKSALCTREFGYNLN